MNKTMTTIYFKMDTQPELGNPCFANGCPGRGVDHWHAGQARIDGQARNNKPQLPPTGRVKNDKSK